MTLYVCGLLSNYHQEIPNDGGYHVIRFGYADTESEEQTDEWGMHTDDPDDLMPWQEDPESGLIYPVIDGYGELYAMIQWEQDTTSRDRFARDPFGTIDTTMAEDRTRIQFAAKAHKFRVYPHIPLSVQVRNLEAEPRRLQHAQFKLYITPASEIAHPVP